MSKYHAGKPGFPLCGAGSIDRFKTTVLTPTEWNAITDKSRRCEHCVEIIRKRNAARAAQSPKPDARHVDGQTHSD